jgi:hypothetical protein
LIDNSSSFTHIKSEKYTYKYLSKENVKISKTIEIKNAKNRLNELNIELIKYRL